VTLASKRKMSQRQKSSRSTRSTQTDQGSGSGGSSSSWSLLDASAGAPGPPVNGDLPGSPFVAGDGDLMMPIPPPPPPRPGSCCATTAATATEVPGVGSQQQLNGEFYEDAATLFDKLLKAEEVQFLPSTCVAYA